MATNTALLGLVIGAYPSISDQEAASKKLVSHHLILLLLLIFTIFIPDPLSSADHLDRQRVDDGPQEARHVGPFPCLHGLG